MLHAPIRHDLSATFLARADGTDAQQIASVHEKLQASARELIAADGLDPDTATYGAGADLRYAGQQFSLTIEAPIGSDVQVWDSEFRREYERSHGKVAGHPPVEFANLRLSVVGPIPDSPAEVKEPVGVEPRRARVICRGEVSDAFVSDRRSFGAELVGPAILCEPDSTVFIPPRWKATTGPAGSVLINKVGAR
jgi:N-methylhydantoinase A